MARCRSNQLHESLLYRLAADCSLAYLRNTKKCASRYTGRWREFGREVKKWQPSQQVTLHEAHTFGGSPSRWLKECRRPLWVVSGQPVPVVSHATAALTASGHAVISGAAARAHTQASDDQQPRRTTLHDGALQSSRGAKNSSHPPLGLPSLPRREVGCFAGSAAPGTRRPLARRALPATGALHGCGRPRTSVFFLSPQLPSF